MKELITLWERTLGTPPSEIQFIIWVEIIGMIFGRLTVLERLANDKHAQAIYECECSCGQTTEVRRCHLLCGATRSCGCFRRQVARRNINRGMWGRRA
jgi:hypothetical protein